MKKTKNDWINWINEPPSQNEIDVINNAEFLPIGIVEQKLLRLDPYWGTENFKFQVIEIMGVPLVSGSLELILTYGARTRRLIGASTLTVDPSINLLDPYINSNFAATLKSECTKNACKPIGLAFGQGLNDRTVISQPSPQAPKNGLKKPHAVTLQPDAKMQQQYNEACENSNQPMLKAIQAVYAEIKYTGIQKLNYAES